TGTIEESFKSKHMERGTEQEPKAIQHYELLKMKMITEVGFYTFLDFGDSPDGIIENDRAIEIKNPKTTTHYDYYLNPESLFKKYKWQGYGHMIASHLLKCDYISFDNRFGDDKKMVIYTEEYRQEEADKLIARLNECEAKIKEFCNA
ncbi:MAG: YqaJ viral recombinase family protein, partial [bacterium]|nr:YqaJ viral recombinase family protein [bacterium]